MKLSVIVPVYQVEKSLRCCVESILDQSFSDYELLLVDDGSTDGSSALCDELAAGDARIKVMHKQNGGLSSARNAGLDIAQGDYVAFVDSDDYLVEETFQPLMDILDDDIDTDILEFPVKQKVGTPQEHLLTFYDAEWDDTMKYWLDCEAYNHTYAWNKIYRRSLWNGVRFPEGKNFEDVWTLPLLLSKHPMVRTTNVGQYNYVFNAEGITAQNRPDDLKSLLDGMLAAAKILGVDWNDDKAAGWYFSVLNIQLDVNRLTGEEPLLPSRSLPRSLGRNWKDRLKIDILNKYGLNRLCKMHRRMKKVF